MVCKHCGHHSENTYGVCPCCGQVVKKPKGFTAGLVMLVIGICFVIIATAVVCVVVFSSADKTALRVDSYDEPYVYDDISQPDLQAEPLPQGDYILHSESLPRNDSELKKEPELKSEPVKQPETTPAKTENVNIVFSNEIGKVNGKTYAIRCVGKHLESDCYCGANGVYNNMSVEETSETIIPALPQKLKKDNMAFASFCYYDGYVYYIEAEPGTGEVSRNIYRCKSDFTGVELLAEWEADFDGDSDYRKGIDNFFVICDNVLYMNSSGYSIELSTKKIAMREYPNFSQYQGTHRVSETYICDDMVFVNNDVEGYIYLYGADENKVLVKNLYGFTNMDGYSDGWLYYSVSVENGRYGELYRVNVETGKTEYLHKANMGGGYGPYFCF